MLVTTGAFFWGARLLQLASKPILQADAFFISRVFGLDHYGNTVSFADGGGFVWIAPECSSFHNVSLAVLDWGVMTRYRGIAPGPSGLGCMLAAFIGVVATNVVRVGLMTRFHDQFDLIHGPFGATIAGSVSLASRIACCITGAKPVRLA